MTDICNQPLTITHTQNPAGYQCLRGAVLDAYPKPEPDRTPFPDCKANGKFRVKRPGDATGVVSCADHLAEICDAYLLTS